VNAGPEEAVLITGVYGSGKSSVAQEMAYLLEKQGVPYALLDLDFLGWADTGGGGRPVWFGVMLRNLAALVGNYLEIGVRFFVLAGAIRDLAELEALEAKLSMPLRVVRLNVPLQKIEDRLRPDPTAGRRDDLRGAASWIAASVGVGVEDATVSNDRPIREVASDILEWLDWQATEDA
jgi:energy-coupling factor transporter ATP-binding protein EcfA2